MQIAVIGSGMVGTLIATELSKEYQITVFDNSKNSLANLEKNNKNIKLKIVDVNDKLFEKEIKHYIDKTKKLLSKNILPIITFHHFTTPEWLMDDGLWASEKTTTAFVNYVDVMMQHLPKEIELFNTINEPGIFSMFGYLSKKKFPPAYKMKKYLLKHLKTLFLPTNFQ